LGFFSAVLAAKLLRVSERLDIVMVGSGGLQTAYNKEFSTKKGGNIMCVTKLLTPHVLRCTC